MTKSYTERVEDELAHPDANINEVLEIVLLDYELLAFARDAERKEKLQYKAEADAWWERANTAEQFVADAHDLFERFMEFKQKHLDRDEDGDT